MVEVKEKEEYQVMPELSENEYESLKKDIEENGVKVPITIDEEGYIIDGYHRVRACDELDVEPPKKVVANLDEPEKVSLSWKLNMQRRHLDKGSKKEMAKKRIKQLVEMGEDFTWGAVADELGISEERVHTAKDELLESNKLDTKSIRTNKQKRQQVREALEENPEKSNVEIAEELDVSDPFVGKVRKEMEGESGEESVEEEQENDEEKTFEAYVSSDKDLEKVKNISEKVEEGDEDAKEVAKEIEKGKSTVANAHRNFQRRKTEERRKENRTKIPEGEYDVILADPPWNYNFSQSKSREIENQYPTMDVEEIKEKDIPSSEDSVLFLWATAPKLEEALEVMDAWGFDYVTNAVWDKEKMGMGYWFRNRHELILVGKKGNHSPPSEDERIESVIREERKEHSKKPKIHEFLEKWWPDSNYLELFGREKREGWVVWGDEVE